MAIAAPRLSVPGPSARVPRIGTFVAWTPLMVVMALVPVPRPAVSIEQLVGPETRNWTSVPGKIGLPLTSTIFMRIKECDVLLRAGMISTVFGVAEIVVPAAAAAPLQITLNVK